jgi:hypothetical protein
MSNTLFPKICRLDDYYKKYYKIRWAIDDLTQYGGKTSLACQVTKTKIQT